MITAVSNYNTFSVLIRPTCSYIFVWKFLGNHQIFQKWSLLAFVNDELTDSSDDTLYNPNVHNNPCKQAHNRKHTHRTERVLEKRCALDTIKKSNGKKTNWILTFSYTLSRPTHESYTFMFAYNHRHLALSDTCSTSGVARIVKQGRCMCFPIRRFQTIA